MHRQILIGAVSGLAAAVLYIAFIWPAPLGLASLFIAPLPLFLAGLSSGLPPAAIAIVSSWIAVASFAGVGVATTFAVVLALPTLALVYLALLKRTVEDVGGPSRVEWYPAGRLLADLTFMSVGFIVLAALLTASEPGGLKAASERTLLSFFGSTDEIEKLLAAGGTGLTAEQYLEAVSTVFPALVGISFVIQLAANAALAQRLLVRRGYALRPSPALHDLSLPLTLDIALVAAIFLAFLPGSLGFLAGTIAGVFLLPYFLLGLVVVHVISTGWPNRGLILTAFYVALLMLSMLILLIAVLGLVETMVGLRRRLSVGAAKS